MDATTEHGGGDGRARLLAFRVVSVVGAILGLPSLYFTYVSLVEEADRPHVVHNAAQLWTLLALVTVPLLAGVRRPANTVAPFRLFLGFCVAMLAGGMLGGDLLTSGYLLLSAIAAALLALHPARADVWRCVRGSPALLILAVLELVPAFTYALREGDLQRNLPPSESHVVLHHYSGMAYVSLSLGLAAIATAFPGSGRRLAVWLAGTSALLLGLTDLAFPIYAGSLNPMWAWSLIVWGALVIVVGLMEVRRQGSGDATPAWLDEP